MMDSIRKIPVDFSDRTELRKHFLVEPPYGGLSVPAADSLLVGDVVTLQVGCIQEKVRVDLSGVVLWCRQASLLERRAGVGFFASEINRREKLLSDAPSQPPEPPPTTPVAERHSPRFQAVVKVTYEDSDHRTAVYTRNISSSGAFIKADTPPETGSSHLFHLFPPGKDAPITIPGQVAWGWPGKGFGVRFDEGSLLELERVNSLLGRSREIEDTPTAQTQPEEPAGL